MIRVDLPAGLVEYCAVVSAVIGTVCLWEFYRVHASGWRQLEKVYAAPFPFQGERLPGLIWMRGYLDYGMRSPWDCYVGVTPHGLWMSVSLFNYRLGHAPLIIPWTDITGRDGNAAMTRSIANVELRFARVPGVPCRIDAITAQRIADEAGPLFPWTQKTVRRTLRIGIGWIVIAVSALVVYIVSLFR